MTNRLLMPLLTGFWALILISVQCTTAQSWQVWGVRMELLPPLLLYSAFTLNLSSALILGALAGVVYDSYSGGAFGASLLPYIFGIALFCALRPIFFRNSLMTQFFSGVIFGWIALTLQWMLCGKWMVGFSAVATPLFRLSLICGVLTIVYFLIFDLLFKWMGFTPGRFDD